MEPEDLPWPSELEEEPENLDEDEVVMVEEVEEEFQRWESTDEVEEEDDEARAWLQAPPIRILAPPTPLRRRQYSEGERACSEKVVPLTGHVWQQSLCQGNNRTQISNTGVVSLETTTQWCSGNDQRTESWHCLPQEMDSSQTLVTSLNRLNAREEGSEVADFPSMEEGTLTQSENQVKEHSRDSLYSPLLVIQDSFASPDLPLLTCLTRDQDCGPDSLFHQSELHFEPLRGIPDRSEDTGWLSRPSEVNEALFQAASEVVSDLVNSCFSVSHHPLISSAEIGPRQSFVPLEQGNKEETISSHEADETKTAKDSDSYTLSSHVSRKSQKVIEQPETNSAIKDQVSFSSSSEISTKGSDSFAASCSYAQSWKQEAVQQPETCLTSKDHVSFPHEIASRLNNKISQSFLPFLLERRGQGFPLMSDSRYYESVDLKAIPENEMKQRLDSLEDYKRNEDVLKEVSQHFEQKEARNNLVSSDTHPRSSETQHIGNVVVSDNSIKVSQPFILSRRHDASKMEASGGILQTVKFNLSETSEQLYFQGERSQKETSAFGAVVDAIENVAFEAVIASIEPSKRDNTIKDIQADSNKSLTNASQEREPKIPEFSLSNYNDEKSLFDQLSHPCYQSTPGVFEPAASKSWLHRKDVDDSSLGWHPNLKSPAPQDMLIKSFSVIPKLKLSASLSEKSHNKAVGLSKTESPLFQCDVSNESFVPIGTMKSDPVLDVTEKVEFSSIYPLQVSTSDSLVLEDLKQQTSEEVADSSNYISVKHVNSDNITEGRSAAVGSSSPANLVACDEKSQSASPSSSDTSLIALLPKADVGQSEIPQGMEAKFRFTIHTDIQKDSCCVECLQGAAESDLITPDGDTECHRLDEDAVMCSERIAKLLREVGGSNLGINQPFSSILPHGPTREPEYHSSNLGMLRLSFETVPKTLGHLSGNAFKGGTAEITQYNLKTGTTANSEDSDFGSDLSLPTETLPHLAVRPPQEKTVDQRTDDFLQQPLLDGHLNEDTLKVSALPGTSGQKTGILKVVPPSSYRPREKLGKSVLYQQGLPNSHLTEENLKVSHVPEPADQKTRIQTVPSSSSSHREEPSLFCQQEFPDSHLTGEDAEVSAFPGPADQKIGTPTVIPDSYSQREKPSIFYQQELPDSHLPEVTMKSSAFSGQSVQKTGIPTIPFSSFSHREKPNTFYQQELSDSHLTEVAPKSSAVSGLANQKTEIPKGPSCSCSRREKRTSLRERVLPDSRPTEEDLKVAPVPGQTDQKTETPTIPCSFCSLREMPTVLYQQLLPDSHLSEASLKSSAVPGPSDQMTGMPSRPPGSYSLREKPTILHQQVLPDSHVAEVALKSSTVSWPPDQKTGMPTVSTGLYTHAEKLSSICQHELPNSHLNEEDIKISPATGPADQKTRISTEPSGSYSQKEQPGVFCQQELSDIHLTEEVLKSSSVSGPADQKTETSTVLPVSSSQREKPSLFYQQVFPVNQVTEVALKSLIVPRPADQKTGTLNVFPGSYTHGEIPIILHQQALPDSHLTEEALKSSAVPGLADQKTWTTTVPPGSYSYKEKPTLLYHQVLPEDHLTEEALKVSAVPGESDQKTRIPTVQPSSYSYIDKPTVLCQQVLPDSNLAKEDLKVLVVPGPAEQKTHMPTVSPASCSLKEKPMIFCEQLSPDSHITGIILESSPLPEPTDLMSGIPAVLPDSYSRKENLNIFYQQELPDSHLTEVILTSSTAPGPADQKTKIPTLPLGSSSDRQKPIILHQQVLPDSHLPVVALKSSTPSGPADQKTGTPTLLPDFYSQREMPSILYQQALPETHLTEGSLKVSTVPGPGDQKSGIVLVPLNSYPLREKPNIFYQQLLTDNHLTEEALKVLSVSRAAEQKTITPTVPSSSYSQRDKSSALHQQALPDSYLSEVALKSLTVLGSAGQKTGLSTVPPSSYSHRDKPGILHQQVLTDSHLTEDSLKVSAIPGPADEKSGILTVSSNSYLHREKPSILHQQALPDSHLTEESLKVPAVPGSADQKTGIPSIPLGSCSHIEKPSVFSQQAFVDGHLSDEALKISTVLGPTDQKTGTPTVSPSSYSQREKSNVFYQSELPDGYLTYEDLKFSVLPVPADQNTAIPTVPPGASSHREKSSVYLQDFLDSHLTEAVLKDPAVPGLANKKPGISILPPSTSSHKDKPIILHEQELPDNLLTEEALKISTLPGLANQNTGLLTAPSDSSSHTEKFKISAVIVPDDQKTGLPAAPPHSYLHKEKAKVSVGPDEHKTPLLTVSSNSYPQGVKPSVSFQQKLPDRHQNEDTLKVSSVPEPTDGNTEIPVSLSSSSSHKEKSNILYAQGLPDRHLIEDSLKVSVHLGPADQKTVLPKALPSSSLHRENPNIFFQPDLPDRHVAEDAHKVSGVLGQADQITQAVLPTISPGIYSHSGRYKVGSEHVQRLRETLDSSESSITSNNRPLNSQADGRVVINKPVSLGFGDFSSEEPQEMDSSSKTLKEIQALLMEAENIALKRCNVPASLVPFRDVRDISYMQSKKVVCFKEPSTTAESNDDRLQKQPFLEETPSNSCIQKDINTQTNVKCQRGIENWEFISSTTVRSPLQEAESTARAALEETLKEYEAAKYVMRSEPEGCCETIGNKIVFPMMTFIKSNSCSDTSDGNGSCSWDSNFPESLGSVSDVLLNFFPDASPNISMTDSREEDDVSESDDGGGGSVDSLAAHVKNLLQCESSLNHAKQILRDAEEEERQVRAQAWNLKFNLAHDCGYSISALNEDDRRKVEEIKAKLFGQGRTTDLSKGLQSPQETGCKPEAVCSHIIIERHEKGCFRTLTAEEPQLDSHSCIFRSAEPPEMIRGQWRAQNVNLSRSLDQNTSHFKVWNSLHLRSHSPFQNFSADSFKISKGLQMPFREKMDPWLSELVEPACVPPEEMDCHSSSQLPPPEPVTQFITSITFSSHQHSKCISDSSVFKVGVTEGSQGTGASVGVFNSHVTEEQSTLRDPMQRMSSPSSCKMLSHSPDKDQTILAESVRQSQKLPVDFEHSHQEEKLLEISDFEVTNSEPSPNENCSSFRETEFSDNHTLISMGRRSSTLGVKEKNVIVTSDPPPIFLEQRELFEQSKTPHADHHVNQGQDYMASDLPSPVFLEQRKLFEQSKAPHVDHHVRKPPFPLPQGQDCVVEKDNQHMLKSHTSNLINVEAKFSNVVSQSAPNHSTLVTSASTPPSNRKILSCVHITLSPKTPSNLDGGALHKRLHSLDPASKTRMNSVFNSDLQILSSRSLEPTSKLLTIKPIAQHQESVGFLGPKSSLDFQIVQSLLPDSNNTVNQDLKNVPSQNSQIVTSRQTQVNFSDLEEYSNPEGTPLSADRPPEEIKTPFSAFSRKLSSDAVTQITTESPEKTTFSSEIFINAEDRGHEIPGPFTQKVYRIPAKFALSSVQQIAPSHGTAQPLLLPYKPSGGTEMYYVPQLRKIPQFLDAKSDSTVESSHSGSNDAIAPDFPAQVLGMRDDKLSDTVNIKHKEGIYSKRAVTKRSWSVVKKPFQKETADATVQVAITGNENVSGAKQMEDIYNKRAVTKVAQPGEESLQKDTAGYSDAAAEELSAQVQDTEIEKLPATKAVKEKEIYSKKIVPELAWPEKNEPLLIDTAESRGHSQFENTAHSVFRSAQFDFHPPVHLPSDQDVCRESLGRGVSMRNAYVSLPYQKVDKANKDYATMESLSVSLNMGNKEAMHNTKSQTRDNPKCNRQINDPRRNCKVTSEPTTQQTASLNELWNRYQERQRQRKSPQIRDTKELTLVERLDRLAKLLQNPITHSLHASESTHDYSEGKRDVKEWTGRQQEQKNKLQKKKRYKSPDKFHKNTGDLKKSKVLSPHQAGRSNQIKIEQIKFGKYILRKQPAFNYISNTSSDSRPSEESELLTDTATNILSTTTSPGESDVLTQTDKEVALPERSSSVSTIDTARLIQAFGHERICLSPRQIKLYGSITNQQRRCLEKRIKQSKKGHFQMTSEHTRRKNIQVEKPMISSDSVSSSASSLWSSSLTLSSKQNVHMLNKGIQAGNLEIVNGAKKHTRDVGMTFPTPSSSEARLEEDDTNSSRSEEKNEEKRLLTCYMRDKKLRKNKPNSCKGISWFVPVENLKSGSKKENLLCGRGVCWFEPITNTKPWREPLREKNSQGQQMDSRGFLAGPGRDFDKVPPRPFVRASLQESLQFHRPDFISHSGERIKHLKLIVQERKLQNVLQSERDALFNSAREWQGCQGPVHPLCGRAAQKYRPVGKKEMIQRSKRIYEQLPEVQKKREEEKRRSEYKSNWLRAQLYKKKVTNRLLGRKVPWD